MHSPMSTEIHFCEKYSTIHCTIAIYIYSIFMKITKDTISINLSDNGIEKNVCKSRVGG